MPMTAPNFLRLYVWFAAAYMLSYTYRTVNAVISPELTAALGISASSLGLLTSAYFIAFASMQVPAGILLDRYGPRRVEPVLLVIATLGALAFAAADNLAALTAARACIGAGVAVCLMAPLKAIATWYPPERQPSLGSWMMFAGGAGALLSTTPLVAALTVLSWRGIFVVLAAATLAVAIAIAIVVPDTPHESRVAGASAPWRGGWLRPAACDARADHHPCLALHLHRVGPLRAHRHGEYPGLPAPERGLLERARRPREHGAQPGDVLDHVRSAMGHRRHRRRSAGCPGPGSRGRIARRIRAGARCGSGSVCLVPAGLAA